MKDIVRLGEMVDALEQVDPDSWVSLSTGGYPGRLHSYRGYYKDIAITPVSRRTKMHRVRHYIKHVRHAIGRVFTGYKGGDYMMHDTTPVWVAPESQAWGNAVVGVMPDGNGSIVFVVERVED